METKSVLFPKIGYASICALIAASVAIITLLLPLIWPHFLTILGSAITGDGTSIATVLGIFVFMNAVIFGLISYFYKTANN